jgi:hypothetical protein
MGSIASREVGTMDEDKDEERKTATKLLKETEQQIAPENKVTDPSPKLSEQGLVIYKAMFDQISLIKKQQWTITNYAALLYGAIFVFANRLSKETYGETVILTTATAAVCWYGTAMLVHTKTDLSDARKRLGNAIEQLFKDPTERDILGLKKETEPFIHSVEFTIPLLGVIWFGAAMLIYYLIYYIWSKA